MEHGRGWLPALAFNTRGPAVAGLSLVKKLDTKTPALKGSARVGSTTTPTRAKAGPLHPSLARPSRAPRPGWRAVRERGSVGPHVPARGAWCTTGARNS